MDTLTVTLVIRMTGLLLLTPHTAANNHPTHVLMPQTGRDVTEHVAQIGFRGPNRGCAWYQDGICYVNMHGWSLEIGRQGNATGAVRLPVGAVNVSAASGRRVPPHLLQSPPNTDRLRSRVTLHGGAVTDTCALARWTFQGQAVEMPNVVEWSMAVPKGPLVLERRELNRPSRVHTVATLRPDDGIIELYIRHVPVGEQDHYAKNSRLSPLTPPLVLGDPSPHFHAFYDLLGAGSGERPLPHYRGKLNTRCPWVRTRANAFVPLRDSPGTITCMMTSGTPN